MDIIKEIEEKIEPGTIIPKPKATQHVVKGWGKRRGERALIYQMPNHSNHKKLHEKGINVSEWEKAYYHISNGEDFSKKWFNKNIPECKKEGDCNFTSIGGIFQLLGLVHYEPGLYKPR